MSDAAAVAPAPAASSLSLPPYTQHNGIRNTRGRERHRMEKGSSASASCIRKMSLPYVDRIFSGFVILYRRPTSST